METKAVKPLVFYFNFYNEDEEEADGDTVSFESETYLGFVVQDPSPIYKKFGVSLFKEFLEKIYSDCAEEIESEFGVHDWSSSPCDEVDAIGYTTYEVEKENQSKLMETWRNVFKDAGCECTEVVVVNDDSDDFAIYNDIMKSVNKPKLK